MNVDEYEAIRLVDYDGLDQEKAGEKLGISRATCARIIESAHRKIAEAITQAKAIRIEGGSFVLKKNLMRCMECGRVWETTAKSGEKNEKKVAKQNPACPQCSGCRLVNLGEAVGGGWRGRGRKFGRGGQGGRGGGYP